tara:strand:- start:640 stop:1770 length:1131 start_codon:yes stop_codon:yes gene_type:complete
MGLGLAGWMPTMSFLSTFLRDNAGDNVMPAALIMICIHAGSVICGLFAGPIMAHFGSRRTFSIGLGGQAAYLWILALIPNPEAAFYFAILAGIFLAFHWTGLQSALIEVAPTESRGLASGIASFVLVLSPGIAGLIMSLIAGDSGLSVFGPIAASLASLAFILSLITSPSTSPIGNKSQPGLSMVKNLVRRRGVYRMFIIRGVGAMSYAVFNLLAGPRLYDVGGGLEFVGLFLLGGSLAGGFAQVALGKLSDILGRSRLFGLVIALAAMSSAGFAFAEDISYLLCFSSLHWFAQSAYQTLGVALGGDASDKHEIGTMNALLTVCYSIGLASGALISGFLSGGAETVVLIVNALLLLTTVKLGFSLHHIKPRTSTEI